MSHEPREPPQSRLRPQRQHPSEADQQDRQETSSALDHTTLQPSIGNLGREPAE